MRPGETASPSDRGSGPEARGAPRTAPFVVFEGIEGCGKTTQIARLSAELSRARRSHLVTREPGGTPLGDALRELLLSPAGADIDGLVELYLLEAARRMHVRHVIRPALARGVAVLSDRFGDSSVAYQGGARGLGLEMVDDLNRQATDDLRADVTILLDLPVRVGLARVGRRGRGEDRLEREAIDFHERVREAYLEIAGRPGSGYRVIDAGRTEDEVWADVGRTLAPYFAGDLAPS